MTKLLIPWKKHIEEIDEELKKSNNEMTIQSLKIKRARAIQMIIYVINVLKFKKFDYDTLSFELNHALFKEQRLFKSLKMYKVKGTYRIGEELY